MDNTRRTKAFIGAMLVAAAGVTASAGYVSHRAHPYLALAVLAMAAATSRMKVKLPGINGNMSMNLPFLLTAVLNLSAAETVAITVLSTVVQCWPQKRARLNPQQMTFNLSMMAFASAAASLMVRVGGRGAAADLSALPLVLATLTLFLGQTCPVAGIVAFSEGRQPGSVWWTLAHLSFPYFVLSAGVTAMVQSASAHLGWGLALAVFPVMSGIYRSYRLYFGRLAETLAPRVLARAAGAGA